MKFNNKYKVTEEFEDLFAFSSEEEELNHDAQMLTFKFLEEIEKCYAVGPKLRKKHIAKVLGKSPSFISQLYSGDKLLNFGLLAKIQKEFNLSFEIKAKLNEDVYANNNSEIKKNFSYHNEFDGFWVWKKRSANYTKPDENCDINNEIATEITAA